MDCNSSVKSENSFEDLKEGPSAMRGNLPSFECSCVFNVEMDEIKKSGQAAQLYRAYQVYEKGNSTLYTFLNEIWTIMSSTIGFIHLQIPQDLKHLVPTDRRPPIMDKVHIKPLIYLIAHISNEIQECIKIFQKMKTDYRYCLASKLDTVANMMSWIMKKGRTLSECLKQELIVEAHREKEDNTSYKILLRKEVEAMDFFGVYTDMERMMEQAALLVDPPKGMVGDPKLFSITAVILLSREAINPGSGSGALQAASTKKFKRLYEPTVGCPTKYRRKINLTGLLVCKATGKRNVIEEKSRETASLVNYLKIYVDSSGYVKDSFMIAVNPGGFTLRNVLGGYKMKVGTGGDDQEEEELHLVDLRSHNADSNFNEVRWLQALICKQQGFPNPSGIYNQPWSVTIAGEHLVSWEQFHNVPEEPAKTEPLREEGKVGHMEEARSVDEEPHEVIEEPQEEIKAVDLVKTVKDLSRIHSMRILFETVKAPREELTLGSPYKGKILDKDSKKNTLVNEYEAWKDSFGVDFSRVRHEVQKMTGTKEVTLIKYRGINPKLIVSNNLVDAGKKLVFEATGVWSLRSSNIDAEFKDLPVLKVTEEISSGLIFEYQGDKWYMPLNDDKFCVAHCIHFLMMATGSFLESPKLLVKKITDITGPSMNVFALENLLSRLHLDGSLIGLIPTEKENEVHACLRLPKIQECACGRIHFDLGEFNMFLETRVCSGKSGKKVPTLREWKLSKSGQILDMDLTINLPKAFYDMFKNISPVKLPSYELAVNLGLGTVVLPHPVLRFMADFNYMSSFSLMPTTAQKILVLGAKKVEKDIFWNPDTNFFAKGKSVIFHQAQVLPCDRNKKIFHQLDWDFTEESIAGDWDMIFGNDVWYYPKIRKVVYNYLEQKPKTSVIMTYSIYDDQNTSYYYEYEEGNYLLDKNEETKITTIRNSPRGNLACYEHPVFPSFGGLLRANCVEEIGDKKFLTTVVRRCDITRYVNQVVSTVIQSALFEKPGLLPQSSYWGVDWDFKATQIYGNMSQFVKDDREEVKYAKFVQQMLNSRDFPSNGLHNLPALYQRKKQEFRDHSASSGLVGQRVKVAIPGSPAAVGYKRKVISNGATLELDVMFLEATESATLIPCGKDVAAGYKLLLLPGLKRDVCYKVSSNNIQLIPLERVRNRTSILGFIKYILGIDFGLIRWIMNIFGRTTTPNTHGDVIDQILLRDNENAYTTLYNKSLNDWALFSLGRKAHLEPYTERVIAETPPVSSVGEYFCYLETDYKIMGLFGSRVKMDLMANDRAYNYVKVPDYEPKFNRRLISPRFYDEAGSEVSCENLVANLQQKEKYTELREGFHVTTGPKLEMPQHRVQLARPCDNGVIYAIIGRQFHTPLMPSRNFVRGFAKFSHSLLKSEWARMKSSLMRELCDEDNSIEAYFQKIDKAKLQNYRRGYEKFLETGKLAHHYQAFQKFSEANYKNYDFRKVRPRNIFNPPEDIKAVLGCYNQLLLKCLSRFHFFGDQEYCSCPLGMNNTEIEDNILKMQAKIKNPIWANSDGSAWDAHQDWRLIRAVDNMFIEMSFDSLIPFTGIDSRFWPEIKKALLEMTVSFTAFYQGTRNIMMTAKMKGTTFTGAPTRTTFGNTLRNFCLQAYVAHLTGLSSSDIGFQVYGDDNLVCLNEDKLKLYEEKFYEVFVSHEEVGPKLSGIVAELKISGKEKFNFLSKVGTVRQQKCVMVRDPFRFYMSGSFMDKSNLAHLTPAEHSKAVIEGLFTETHGSTVLTFLLQERILLHLANYGPTWFEPLVRRKIHDTTGGEQLTHQDENLLFGFDYEALMGMTPDGIAAILLASKQDMEMVESEVLLQDLWYELTYVSGRNKMEEGKNQRAQRAEADGPASVGVELKTMSNLPLKAQQQIQAQLERQQRPIYNKPVSKEASAYTRALYKYLQEKLGITEDVVVGIPKRVAEQAREAFQYGNVKQSFKKYIKIRMNDSKHDWKAAGNKLLEELDKLPTERTDDLALYGNYGSYVYAGDGRTLYRLRLNPGIVNLNLDDETFSAIDKLPTHLRAKLNEAIHNLVLSYSTPAKAELKPETLRELMENDLSNMRDFDPSLIRTLSALRSDLLMNKVNVEKLRSYVNTLRSYYYMSEDLYVASLLDAFGVDNARVPSMLPLASSAFKITSTVTLTTNPSGNLALGWCPWYLNTVGATTLGVNNDNSLLGNAPSNHFLGVAIGHSMPADFYTQYRLVSAAIKIQVTSSALQTSGYICAANAFGLIGPTAQPGIAIASYAQYGNFLLIQNAFDSITESAVGAKTLSRRWMPKDDLDYNYTQVGATQQFTTAILMYATGMPASSSCIKVDFAMNFEAIPNPEYADYIPKVRYTSNLGELERSKTLIRTPGFSSTTGTTLTTQYSKVLTPSAQERVSLGEKQPTDIPVPVENSTLSYLAGLFNKAVEYGKTAYDIGKSVMPYAKAASEMFF